MATRVKDWEVPYVWGDGIEITENHIINVLLREANNLIHVNEDRELYVDLQLDDWITPDDDFPVGVTTGKILAEDWWQQSWLILNWKTTSGDYNRLIYANDGNLYIDLWDWVWRLLGEWESPILQCNTKTFWIQDTHDLTNAQAAYDWYISGKNAIIIYRNPSWWYEMFSLSLDLNLWNEHDLAFAWAEEINVWTSQTRVKAPIVQIQAEDWVVTAIFFQYWREYGFIDPSATTYSTPFMATEDYHPATKKYVDNLINNLASQKQDVLTAGTRISIVVDPNTGNTVISADVSGVLTYKGNVSDPSQLPSSGNTVWDCWFSESNDIMYAWDGTQWNAVWSITPSLTQYFNKNTDDSDDIQEWSNKLFVSPSEKADWDAKQDPIIAGNNITIDPDWRTINAVIPPNTTYTEWHGIEIDINNVIKNTLPFEAENVWAMGQFLKRTSTWYAWADIPWGWWWGGWWWGWWWGWSSYSAGYWIKIQNRTITNTLPFDPINEWQFGQILMKTQSGMIWTGGATCNIKFWNIHSQNVASSVLEDIVNWLSNWENWAIINDYDTKDSFISAKTENTAQWIVVTFYGRKRISHVNTRYAYTNVWEQMITITKTEDNISMTIGENPDDSTHTNYISAMPIGYDGKTPFRPTEPYQPATKQYVDEVATGWVQWVITNNQTWTTTVINQEWAGSETEYSRITPQQWVIYNIFPD